MSALTHTHQSMSSKVRHKRLWREGLESLGEGLGSPVGGARATVGGVRVCEGPALTSVVWTGIPWFQDGGFPGSPCLHTVTAENMEGLRLPPVIEEVFDQSGESACSF